MTKTFSNQTDSRIYQKQFSISQLIIGIFLGTYFLSVELVEFSLSNYVEQENKLELYRDYLIFKRQAPLWRWWQLLTTLIVPLSIIDTLRELFRILTEKTTTVNRSLSILTALQLFGILYTIITFILPLESKLLDESSSSLAQDLKFYHGIALLLNILGWLIPLFRYHEWKNYAHICSDKKTE
jgi:hypothetical protein